MLTILPMGFNLRKVVGRGIYVGDEAVALISSVIILDVYKASASAYQRNLGGRIRGASKMEKTFPQLSSRQPPALG